MRYGDAAAIAAEQHRRDLAWFVALLREQVKAQEHDGCADYWIDGEDLADQIGKLAVVYQFESSRAILEHLYRAKFTSPLSVW